ERDERIGHVLVLLGQDVAERRAHDPVGRHRDVRVLGNPERLEAALLGGRGEPIGADRVLGVEAEDAQFHAVRLPSSPKETPMHRSLAALALAGLLAVPRASSAQMGGSMKDALANSTPAERAAFQTDVMKEKLALTAEQAPKVQAINLETAQ